GNTREALAVAEELISLQPKNSSHLLRKASILKRRKERLQCIEAAISINPYSVQGYLDKARLLVTWSEREHGQEKIDLVSQARQVLDRGVELDPNWRNPCWREKFNLLQRQVVDREKCRIEQEEIIAGLKKQNPFTTRILTMRQIMLLDKDQPKIFDDLLDDIQEGRERASLDKVTQFDVIKLKVLAKLDNSGKLEDAIRNARSDEKIKNPALASTVASILREKFG
ncbi:MAG TPA: hypothetical protein DCQ77_12320, partial [Betaproteobacteria bacterium]|nr:hypothetical protein [Betaproteobacteria bacterium]